MTNLLSQLKQQEGFVSHIYLDTEKIPTFGYGYNLNANPLHLSTEYLDNVQKNGITMEEAEKLLLRCINDVALECERTFVWWSKLTKVRQEVLINMCFNLGMRKLLGFKKTLRLIEIGDYLNASIEMLHSTWARQVGHRADVLSKQLCTGRYEE